MRTSLFCFAVHGSITFKISFFSRPMIRFSSREM